MKTNQSWVGMLLISLLGFSSAAFAQQDNQRNKRQQPTAVEFLRQHGGNWQVVPQAITGYPSFIYGGKLPLPTPVADDAEYDRAARNLLDQHPELFGITSTELQLLGVQRIQVPGSTTKKVVQYQQFVADKAVLQGKVSIIFDENSGQIIGLESTGIPFTEAISTTPQVDQKTAIAIAIEVYQQTFFTTQMPLVEEVDLQIVGPSAYFGAKNPLTDLGPVLAYVIRLSSPGEINQQGLPIQGVVILSAQDLTVFKIQTTAYATITGNISGNVNTSFEPNDLTNQEHLGLENLWIKTNDATGAVVATTDSLGTFSFTDSATTYFVELRGPFFDVNNKAGSDAAFLFPNVNDGDALSAEFNPTRTEFTTAEVAAAYWVNDFRNYIKLVDPNDVTMDFKVVANVNLSSTCNAFYNGNSINMFNAGNGCVNTSYASVIQHEEGHWANERYNGKFLTGAFHEGAADAWAAYIGDGPCLGFEFHGAGSGCLRDAEQLSILKCPVDFDESCHGGEVHLEGEVLAAALWKVRRNLKAALGDVGGGQVADALLHAWFMTFDDNVISNIIRDHWLALDDDNADPSDGTPHFDAINNAFLEQGWPGLQIQDILFQPMLIPQTNQAVSPMQPVTIRTQITSDLGAVASAVVFYSVDNGASFTQLPMQLTGNPAEYEAKIPGVPSPSTVRWYIEAQSSVGNTATLPVGIDIYHSGLVQQLDFASFETVDDAGWTHACLNGAAVCDQWERGNPALTNDPTDATAAYSPTQIWGTDLSLTGFDGKYEPNSASELVSPVYDFSQAQNVRLQFRRWLAVEEGIYDQAQVLVNNTPIWSNALNGHTVDTNWQLQDYDISNFAAGNPAVQVAFRLTADAGLEFGGWNIDDFELLEVQPAPPGIFLPYGLACAISPANMPALAGIGVPTPNGTVTLHISNGTANALGMIFISDAADQHSVLGGACTYWLGDPLTPARFVLLDNTGAVDYVINLPHDLTKDSHFYFQYFAIGANGINAASNALEMHVR